MFNLLLSVSLLTCEDYDYLTKDLTETGLSQMEIVELMIEFGKATDPKCFELDAND